MEFPNGNVIKTYEDGDVLTMISELEKEGFMGVLKLKALRANVLFMKGEAMAATCGELGGETAWETILQHGSVSAEAHELSANKVQFCFVWYRDVYGYERIYKNEVGREEILEKVGLEDPDKEKLEEILKREGMEHLKRKEFKEPKDI
jgi:hypothetical protein